MSDIKKIPNNWAFHTVNGFTPIINVAGRMTSLGTSITVPQSRDAMAQIMPCFVDTHELQAAASKTIARFCHSEAGFVTACSSAGISLSIAATMTGCDLAHIERLPRNPGVKRDVVLMQNHLSSYGTSVRQAIELCGANPVPIGTSNSVFDYQLKAALGENATAGLYVVSHALSGFARIPLPRFAEICHAAGVPVIVDAAAEQDPHRFLQAGADIVIFSAQKYLGGPTGGIVAGRKALIRAAYMQNIGIGRAMKVGKETVFGIMAALDAFTDCDFPALRATRLEALKAWQTAVKNVAGVQTSIIPDPAGNPVDRLKLTLDPDVTGISAASLCQALAAGTPSIIARGKGIGVDFLVLDSCQLGPRHQEMVTTRLKEIFANVADHTFAEPDPNDIRNHFATEYARWLAE